MIIEISREDLIIASIAFTSFIVLIILITVIVKCKRRQKKPSKRQLKNIQQKSKIQKEKANSLMASLIEARESIIHKDFQKSDKKMRKLSNQFPQNKEEIFSNDNRNSNTHIKEDLTFQQNTIKDFRYEVSFGSYTEESSSNGASGFKNVKRVSKLDFVRNIDKESYAKEQLKSLNKDGIGVRGEGIDGGKVVVYV